MAGTKQPAEAMGFVNFFSLPFPKGSALFFLKAERKIKITRIGRGAFCIG